ncbi:hypothetical protein GJ744_010375 [Endocarpon pusillum]|uniref:Uncharacterized protein n=1 Tax=Endocarpon pusillum TaxID=364733 RepID=A0A8H7E1U2_9EURO|nr:hypothetical protein GJ744_010375 [Endocarpon pusillum]
MSSSLTSSSSSTPPPSTPPSSQDAQDAQYTTPPPPPSLDLQRLRNPRAPNATRDQRLQAQTLHAAGLKYQEIAVQTGLTLYQIHYALRHPATLTKRISRKSKLSDDELQSIINWIYATRANRRTT